MNHDTDTRSPAQLFALAVGAVLLIVGIAGFFVNSSFDHGSDVMGDDLIIFMVNGWHNVVHILSGLFLLAIAGRRDVARKGVLAFAVIYAIVTVYGFVDGKTILHLVCVDDQDNVLHLVLTLAALAAGLATRTTDRHDRGTRGTTASTGSSVRAS
ncbi:MAG: hypothetical protein JWM31_1939 [Solirubrobacterales bacterium]|nr:hypothetical protein [Solirubrobacterales bacterium]